MRVFWQKQTVDCIVQTCLKQPVISFISFYKTRIIHSTVPSVHIFVTFFQRHLFREINKISSILARYYKINFTFQWGWEEGQIILYHEFSQFWQSWHICPETKYILKLFSRGSTHDFHSQE